MGTEQQRLVDSLSGLVGALPGDQLLEAFRASLLTENVFKTLFGNTGERIFTNTQSNVNTKIVPMLEMRWKQDSMKSHDTYLNGKIEGRMLFPISFKDDFNLKRKIALLMMRFIGSDRFDLWERVPGLIMFGEDMSANYSVAFNVSGSSLPGILLDFPYRLDLVRWRNAYPEIDSEELLDGEEFSVETYDLEMTVEKDGTFETVIEDSISNEDDV